MRAVDQPRIEVDDREHAWHPQFAVEQRSGVGLHSGGWTVRCMLAAILIVTVLASSACSTAEATYQPPFSPVILGIDSRGNISVKAEASIVTVVGKFAVGSTVFSSLQPETGTTLVVVRHVQDGVRFDSAYRLNTAVELVAEIDGSTEIRVSDRRVFIDASSGAIRRIDIRPTTPAPQAPVAPTGEQQSGDPGDVLLADSLSSSSPGAASSIACKRKLDGAYIEGVGKCSLAKLPPGNIDITVTTEWRETRSNDSAGLGLSAYPADVSYRISRDGSWKARGISGDTYSEGNSSAIKQRQNRIGLRIRGQVVEFIVNGSRVGRYQLEEDDTDPDRFIGLSGSESSETVFTDFVVKRI